MCKTKLFYFRIVCILSGAFSLFACSSSVQHFANYKDLTTRLDINLDISDASVDSMISPYREKLSETMDEVIAINEQELIKQKPNSNMGNWMCDALMRGARSIYSGNIDFAIQNYGGMRINSMARGDVTVGKIFELMPFENYLVIVELDGTNTKKVLDRIAEVGGWPVSQEISFYISEQKTAENIKINGRDFDINKTYWIATSDYVANGGDNMEYFRKAPIIETGKLIREILIEDCRRYGVIKTDNSSRIYTIR